MPPESAGRTDAPLPAGRPGDEAWALDRDAADPLAPLRNRFRLPDDAAGRPAVYFLGNSLGPAPRAAAAAVRRELERWETRGVDGWFEGPDAWYGREDRLRPAIATLLGARPAEVAAMNALTVDLHLMLASFYRPTGARTRIVVEEPCFPSDRYAVSTHLAQRGADPADALVRVLPDGGGLVDESAIEATLEREGERIALVFVNAVNYLTGQHLDLGRLAAAARRAGARIGVGLAHAAGNVPLSLHDDGIDFAVWCGYKYLNGGPGAVGGCFVHERHHADPSLERLAGWWGNDPETRFRTMTERDFRPRAGAAGWQVSNPPLLSLIPLETSLPLFAEAGWPEAPRRKSVQLTGYLEALLRRRATPGLELLTPADPERRGCQLSLRHPDARLLRRRLAGGGVLADFREPDVLRLAPAPLFNTFHDVWRAARALGAAAAA